MAIAAAAIGAGIGVAGSIFSSKQGSDFSEKAYKHRYQWQVEDMKAAGLNPMLAATQGAPNVPQPHFENVGEGAIKGGTAAFSARQAAKLQEEQLNLMRAQGNKEIAQGDLADAQKKQIMETLPFAAKDAAARIASLETSVDRMRLEMVGIDTDNLRKMNDYEREKALAPLLIQYQKYQNEALMLGMSQKEADAKFYDTLGAADKYGPGLKFIIQMLERYTRGQ